MLPARRRTAVGKQAKNLVRTNTVPAVLYGHGLENLNLEVGASEFSKIFRQAGSSSLVDLVIDESPAVKVLIHDVQRHPTKHEVMHIDFYQVKMTEKLETDIELDFVGESPAVKEQGGIFVRALDKVQVSCLPGDLVHTIAVDISSIKTFEDRIAVKDIVVPKGITILDDPETIVASVTPPRSDAELEALEGAVTEDVSGVEKVEKEVVAEEGDEEAADGKAAEPAKKE